jgi:DNA (cytosine-5)-methyltransferase 1
MLKPRIVDLFCGCSGMGLGAREAGFDVPLSVDIDPILTSSHSLNFNNGKLLLSDLASASGDDIIAAAGGERIDGLVGGPPCQGFSSIGRSDPTDPRRELLATFFRLVAEIQPRFFVMENVRGLLFQKNRALLDGALELLPSRYEVVGPVILDAADFGAATRRKRVFVLGYDRDHADPTTVDDLTKIQVPAATVRDAIQDLKSLVPAGQGEDFDLWKYGSDFEELSAYARLLRRGAAETTGQRKIVHKPDVVARFSKLAPGATDVVGRYPRLTWSGQAPTLRAGTGPDHGSYQAVRPIHPDEPRVITVREAARLQGFPDWFRFHPTAWHSFRMIGNSVSPVLAKALFDLLATRFDQQAAAAAE